jgi:hypothetical protein
MVVLPPCKQPRCMPGPLAWRAAARPAGHLGTSTCSAPPNPVPNHLTPPISPPATISPHSPPALPCPQILQKICWYIVLSPAYSTSVGSSSDVATLLASTLADKQLGDLPSYKTLLQTFVNQEIIPWGTFQAQYADEVKAQAGVFGGEDAAKRAADLKLRVIEHNLQVRGGALDCALWRSQVHAALGSQRLRALVLHAACDAAGAGAAGTCAALGRACRAAAQSACRWVLRLV